MDGRDVICLVIIVLLYLLYKSMGNQQIGKKPRRNGQYDSNSNIWYGETDDEVYLDLRWLFVYAPIYSCPADWKETPIITAVVPMINRSSEVFKVRLKVRSCEKDTVYFIEEPEFIRVSYLGRILGQVMPLPDYYKLKNGETITFGKLELKEESKFKLFGYNVSAKDDYSAQYRQMILSFMIEAGVTDKYEAISHLDFCITTHINKPSHMNAISKWEADRLFVSYYKKGKGNIPWVTKSNPPRAGEKHKIVSQNESVKKRQITEETNRKEVKREESNVKSRYKEGDAVSHVLFGPGIVTCISPDVNHIEIDFGNVSRVFALDEIGKYLK